MKRMPNMFQKGTRSSLRKLNDWNPNQNVYDHFVVRLRVVSMQDTTVTLRIIDLHWAHIRKYYTVHNKYMIVSYTTPSLHTIIPPHEYLCNKYHFTNLIDELQLLWCLPG